MSRLTVWNHGGAVIVGLALGLISPQLGKLPMYALWLGVLLGWTTISARRQPASTRGWWSSIVLWLVALVTYEVYLAVIFAHLGLWYNQSASSSCCGRRYINEPSRNFTGVVTSFILLKSMCSWSQAFGC